MPQTLSLTTLEQRNEFIARHIGPSADDIPAMLDAIGAPTLDALIEQTVPPAIRLPASLPLPDARPEAEALGGLQDVAPILGLLSARLQQRESGYAALFELLLKLANAQVDSQKVAEKIADEARDDTPQALDAVWEEEQVKFFADQGCGESEISAHQRRFAGAVAPQYLNISNGGQQ